MSEDYYGFEPHVVHRLLAFLMDRAIGQLTKHRTGSISQ